MVIKSKVKKKITCVLSEVAREVVRKNVHEVYLPVSFKSEVSSSIQVCISIILVSRMWWLWMSVLLVAIEQ